MLNTSHVQDFCVALRMALRRVPKVYHATVLGKTVRTNPRPQGQFSIGIIEYSLKTVAIRCAKTCTRTELKCVIYLERQGLNSKLETR